MSEEADNAVQIFLLATVGTVFIFVRFAVFWPFALVQLVVRVVRARREKVEAAEARLFVGTFARSLPFAEKAARVSLCVGCRFAQVLRGFEPNEKSVICNYAYPRDVLIAVRECSDYKPKRERIGVGIAIEGAVSHPRLDEMAADSHAAAAVSSSARPS
jgi:hypothetical protein